MNAKEQAHKNYLIQEAWNRYKSDSGFLKVSDPNYRATERRAWEKLQLTLKGI